MFKITDDDVRVLVRIEPTDSIQRLQPVLGDQMVAILKKHGIEMVEDLLKFEPIRFAEIENIEGDEREKLNEVYLYLFRDAYENFHG